MKKLLSTTFISLGVLMAQLWSAALANEGGLILPAQGNANVRLVLQDERTDINPSDVLQVFVGHREACCDGKSPIAGRHRIDSRIVSFDPAFDLIEGQPYTVMTRDKDAANEKARLLTEFTIQQADGVISPEVVAIYPSAAKIPANTLRFYIHFSTPMKPHVSTDYIKLVDAMGTPDTAAFMTFKQELWSEDRKRLTLLMDPGRIKRGVAQNQKLGPALLEGNTYSIVVDEGWPTANGAQTPSRFENIFSVSKALRTRPDPEIWRLVPPRIQSRDPLVIEFDRLFDHERLQSGILVLDELGQPVPGTVSIENDEKTWRFDPQDVWLNTNLKIVIDARLEDVAGNNFREALDHPAEVDVLNIHQKTITVDLKPSR